MSEWRECKLGEILTRNGYIRGPFGSSLKRGEMKDNGIPVYEQKNAIYDSRDFRFFIDDDKFKELSRFQVMTNDLIISCSGTVGKVSIIKEEDPKGIISQALLILRPDIIIVDLKYLYYILSSKQGFELITQVSHGSVQINIAERKVVENIPLKLPPLPEQRAIASVLSSFDDQIDLLHRQNKTLEAMAETLFRQWFVEESDDEWEELYLSDLLEYVVDNRGKTVPTADFGIPLIATNCVKNKNIFPVYEKIRYVSEQIYKDWFRAHPKPGDIIFVNKGTPGCVNIVPNPVDFCIAQDMIALRVNKNITSNYYLFLYLRSNEIQTQIMNFSVGTTIPHLKKTDLLKFPILIPKSNLLRDFDEVVEPIFDKLNNNHLQIRTLEKMRDTLLPKLMSGEVRVDYGKLSGCD